MARQAVGEKRTRQLSRLAGVEFERILVRGGSNHWGYFRTPDDRHGAVKMVPPYVVDWTFATEHWSSCSKYKEWKLCQHPHLQEAKSASS